jgi:hypothetical protein
VFSRIKEDSHVIYGIFFMMPSAQTTIFAGQEQPEAMAEEGYAI